MFKVPYVNIKPETVSQGIAVRSAVLRGGGIIGHRSLRSAHAEDEDETLSAQAESGLQAPACLSCQGRLYATMRKHLLRSLFFR